MTVRYEFYETPAPSDKEDDKPRYHARPVTFSTVDTERLVSDIQQKCSLTRGDVRGALSALSESLAYFLKEGERVHLEGIGYFQVTLTSPPDCNPKKTRAQSVAFKSVKFKADSALKSQLMHLRTERSGFKIHSARLSPKQIDTRLAAYFSKNQVLTRRDFEQICKMTQVTAGRHIKRLLAEGKLKNIGRRLQPIYVKGE